MKAFANMTVLAVILGVAMTGTTAKASFDNDLVAFGSQQIADGALAIRNSLREFGVPRVQQVFFRTGLNQIAQRSLQIVELADGPDNQVEDEIEQLARQNRDTARQLLERAENLGNDELIENMTLLEDFTDQLVDLVD